MFYLDVHALQSLPLFHCNMCVGLCGAPTQNIISIINTLLRVLKQCVPDRHIGENGEMGFASFCETKHQ